MNRRLMKECFHSMRKEKEENKIELMSVALENECLPAIDELSTSIKRTEKQAVQHGRRRACVNIEKTLVLWLRGYFKKWKEVTEYKNIGLSKDLRDRLIRMFR